MYQQQDEEERRRKKGREGEEEKRNTWGPLEVAMHEILDFTVGGCICYQITSISQGAYKFLVEEF